MWRGPSSGFAACIAPGSCTARRLFLCFLFREGFLFPLLVGHLWNFPVLTQSWQWSHPGDVRHTAVVWLVSSCVQAAWDLVKRLSPQSVLVFCPSSSSLYQDVKVRSYIYFLIIVSGPSCSFVSTIWLTFLVTRYQTHLTRNTFSFSYYRSSSLRVRKIPVAQPSFQVGIFVCLGEVSIFGWRWSATSSSSLLCQRKIPLFLSALGVSQLGNREQKEVFAVILYIGNDWSLICDENLILGLIFF